MFQTVTTVAETPRTHGTIKLPILKTELCCYFNIILCIQMFTTHCSTHNCQSFLVTLYTSKPSFVFPLRSRTERFRLKQVNTWFALHIRWNVYSKSVRIFSASKKKWKIFIKIGNRTLIIIQHVPIQTR